MTRNNVWMRLHPDMLATKQRRYCSVCRVRYWTPFGVMCELISFKGTAMYSLADLLLFDLGDEKPASACAHR